MKTPQTIKIAISGSPETGHCGIDALDTSKALGQEIAQHNAITITGAITGFPMWASMGAKDAGGMVIGFSPAVSADEHKRVYRLPTDYTDMFVYTGFGYAGRDLLMIRSADAVIFGCGKIGAIHEFTTAYEEGKIIGVLQGNWKTDEILKKIAEEAPDKGRTIIFDADPRRLVEQVIKKIKEQKK